MMDSEGETGDQLRWLVIMFSHCSFGEGYGQREWNGPACLWLTVLNRSRSDNWRVEENDDGTSVERFERESENAGNAHERRRSSRVPSEIIRIRRNPVRFITDYCVDT